MAGLKLMTQGGYVPRVAPHLLADNEAQRAINTKLYAGDLRSWKKPLPLEPAVFVPSGTQSIYKGKDLAGDPHWISWQNDVDVVKSPLTDAGNPTVIYYTGDGVPKKTNSSLAGDVSGQPPADWLHLGVPAPTSALTLAKGASSVGSVEVTAAGTGYTAVPTVSFSGGGGSGVSAVAEVSGGVVTAINLTGEGIGYTSAPTISITGAGGTSAAATAYRGRVSEITVTDAGSGGKVASVTITAAGSNYKSVYDVIVTNGGSGYTSAPTVTISGGGGTGATATATVSSGVVTAVTITNHGSGYTSNPTVSFSGGGGTGAAASAYRAKISFTGDGTDAVAYPVINSSGQITGATVYNAGKNYTSDPTVAITGGGTGATATAARGTGYSDAPTVTISGVGTGATAQAFIKNGLLIAVVLTDPGYGYTSAPTVSFSGGGGTGGAATAAVVTDRITKIVVTNGGSGYGPVVTFSGGGGSGATAEAVVTNGTISSINVTSGGSGYISQPTVTISGGGGSGATAKAYFTTAETRVYAYTFVSEFGAIEEESAPSPASATIDISDGQQVLLSGFSAPPQANYNITKIRIYRSVTGSASTQFQFVDEVAAPITSYTDSKKAADLGETLGTTEWTAPPSDLRGLCLLPNGFTAGFSKDTVYFSPINAFHAYPENWSISVGANIVGIGVFGQSIAVMTEGYPYIITGTTPEAMTAEKIPVLEPCVAKRSIASDGAGVMYASPNGVCVLGPGVSGLSTGNLMLRDNFQKFNPSSFTSAVFDGKYFGFYTDSDEFVPDGGMILDRILAATPLSITTISADACFIDPDTAKLTLVYQGQIQEWDSDEQNVMPYEWLSKKFVFSQPANLSAIEINANYDDAAETAALEKKIADIIASNQALFDSGADLQSTPNSFIVDEYQFNGSILQNVPSLVDARYLLIEIICDGKVIHTGTYTKNGVYRLPSGFKGQVFEVRAAGNIELRYVKMAETVKELKSL